MHQSDLGLDGADDWLVWPSDFVTAELRRMTPIKLIQLIEGHAPSDADLVTIKAYADGIGPHRNLVTTDLIARAHAIGLLVHVWTLADVEAEYQHFAALGVDGVFSDFPDVAARALHRSR